MTAAGRITLGVVAASLTACSAAGSPAIAPFPTLVGGGTQATFEGGSAHLRASRPVTIAVVGVGRADARAEVEHGAVAEASAGEVRYGRGAGVTEWWRRTSAGLEHGVTLEARPGGSGPLVVEVAVDGAAVRTTGERDAVFEDASGRLATYSGLVALDAGGRSLPARLRGSEAGLVIEVDDDSARYPIVVDPILVSEEAVLTGSLLEDADAAGTSVAISSDGSRAIVGATWSGEAATPDSGNARVFVRSGTAWSEEARLALPGSDGDEVGASVALSGDGSIGLVGAYNSGASGEVYVVTRTGTTWARTATLTTATAGIANFGAAVALSADGTRAVIGAPSGGASASAFVFLRSGTTWTQEARLTGGCGTACSGLGSSVSVSSDGSRAVVGAEIGTTLPGAAVVYARSGTTWAVEAGLAAPAIAGSNANGMGASVAITALGDRVVVGAPNASTTIAPSAANFGRAFVFVRTGAAWAHEGTLDLPSGERTANDFFGRAVAITGDGRRVVVGVPNDEEPMTGDGAGSVRLFERPGTALWTREDTIVRPATPDDGLGFAVALSADGFRLVAGAPNADDGAGTTTGHAVVFRLAHLPTGTTCGAATECLSGFCVDGVCCANVCSGGASDCRACSVAAGAAVDGICGPLSVAVAPTITCLPAAGPCDAAEVCVAGSTTCPADVRRAPGAECRAPTGGCDPAEVCDGTSIACPGDVFSSAGTVCRGASDLCDLEERCPGGGGACPADAVAIAGTTCRTTLAGPCDTADTCDGTSVACTDRFQPAGSTCDGTTSDVCDAPDTCSGSSAVCPELFLSGVECRAASGTCDVAEVCAGSAAGCPPDVLLAPGVVCRSATDPSCDPEEACDGAAAACPADVTSCVMVDAGPVDGGTDAGSPATDAGRTDAAGSDGGGVPGTDAGPPAPAPTGCACRARSADRAWVGPAVALLLAGALARWRH